MRQSFSESNIQQLSVSQRLELISLLWDSIPDSLEALPMPDWQREELKRRPAAADASPESATPWEQVRSRLRAGQ